MMIIDLQNIPTAQRQQYLQTAIAPRPICLASTVDKEGNVNLSPFSFFNMFSTQPPVVIFSPSRRVRNNTTKHTLENVKEVPEVVIHIVDESIVQQVSLSSCEYPKSVNEFVKAGFTQEPATLVKPPMVKEAKVKMECRVMEIKSLGEEGGAGNLVICEVLRMHIDESILNEQNMIDQRKLHHVARLGANWYCRVKEDNLFEVEKPNVKLGIGFDNLPDHIKHSRVLTGNHLGLLANVHEIPEINPGYTNERLTHIYHYFTASPEDLENEIHRLAAGLLDEGKVEEAWQVLLSTG
jgi:flavin reductase (DIM6/NTAB) family NADH-FMN oxidoreductase RutF